MDACPVQRRPLRAALAPLLLVLLSASLTGDAMGARPAATSAPNARPPAARPPDAAMPSLADSPPWPSNAHVTFSTGFDNNKCGLMNQHMMLLSFLTLAITLRVDTVVLPVALSRANFDSPNPDWTLQLPNSIWDIHSIQRLMHRHNITTVVPHLNFTVPADAVHMPQRNPAQTLAAVAGQARELVLAKLPPAPANRTAAGAGGAVRSPAAASEESSYFSSAAVHPVWLHADNLFWMLVTDVAYTHVAMGVHFNPRLVGLADAIADKLRAATPQREFHAMHLRIEKDWTGFFGQKPESVMEDLGHVADLMVSLNFTAGRPPIYIASAIFDPATGLLDRAEYQMAEGWLKSHVGDKQLMNRHLAVKGLMSDTVMETLHSEQEALLDFLVMLHATKAIGFGQSSFSFNMREYRALAGHHRNTTGLYGKLDSIKHYEMTAGLHV